MSLYCLFIYCYLHGYIILGNHSTSVSKYYYGNWESMFDVYIIYTIILLELAIRISSH